MEMSEKDSVTLIKYIFNMIKLVAKGYTGEALVKESDKLTKKIMKKIKNEMLKREIKEKYEKCINQYLKDFGYDNLKLIKNGSDIKK